jgi:hypothetical protein
MLFSPWGLGINSLFLVVKVKLRYCISDWRRLKRSSADAAPKAAIPSPIDNKSRPCAVCGRSMIFR